MRGGPPAIRSAAPALSQPRHPPLTVPGCSVARRLREAEHAARGRGAHVVHGGLGRARRPLRALKIGVGIDTAAVARRRLQLPTRRGRRRRREGWRPWATADAAGCDVARQRLRPWPAAPSLPDTPCPRSREAYAISNTYGTPHARGGALAWRHRPRAFLQSTVSTVSLEVALIPVVRAPTWGRWDHNPSAEPAPSGIEGGELKGNIHRVDPKFAS